jgi:hypothetical protein
MPRPFKCPSCGGPLEYHGGHITLQCHYCSSYVIVPEELRPSHSHTAHHSVPLQIQLAKLAEIGQLIGGGNLIAAIKIYREAFGVGLREAKDAVESLAAGKPVEVSRTLQADAHAQFHQQPMPYATPGQTPARSRKGCSPLVWLAAPLVLFITLICGGLVFYLSMRSSSPQTSTVGAEQTKDARADKRNATSRSGFASPVLSFGSDGIGAGRFKDARSVGFDGEGRIYAADYTGGRVQVFDATGKFITQWMVDAKMPLLRLTADRKGTVYVVQNGDINRYEGLTGKPLGKVEATGRFFKDVTVAADNSLVAVQNGEDIVRFDSSGRQTSVIKNAISTQTDRSELHALVAIDGANNIYALGRFNNAVFKFSPAGKFINRIGDEGGEAGQFRAPQAITVDGQGRIYVSDIKGIQVFDTSGRYLDVFKVEGNVAFGMVFNDKNELLVASRTRIVKFALNQ